MQITEIIEILKNRKKSEKKLEKNKIFFLTWRHFRPMHAAHVDGPLVPIRKNPGLN
jgi:hypothetical protein